MSSSSGPVEPHKHYCQLQQQHCPITAHCPPDRALGATLVFPCFSYSSLMLQPCDQPLLKKAIELDRNVFFIYEKKNKIQNKWIRAEKDFNPKDGKKGRDMKCVLLYFNSHLTHWDLNKYCYWRAWNQFSGTQSQRTVMTNKWDELIQIQQHSGKLVGSCLTANKSAVWFPACIVTVITVCPYWVCMFFSQHGTERRLSVLSILSSKWKHFRFRFPQQPDLRTHWGLRTSIFTEDIHLHVFCTLKHSTLNWMRGNIKKKSYGELRDIYHGNSSSVFHWNTPVLEV